MLRSVRALRGVLPSVSTGARQQVPCGSILSTLPAPSRGHASRAEAPSATSVFSTRTLLDARVHLGHRTRLWNPAMAPYVLGSRNGMHIVDLDKTVVMLRRALGAVKSMAEDGCSFLWLGPGDAQKQRLVSDIAAKAGAYSVEGRWIGGTLTNTVESGQAARFDYKVPDCVFVIDMLRHRPAINEARNVGVPIIGIADTDCNPELLTYPIPGNDDGVHAVNLYCQLMRMAIQEGRRNVVGSNPREVLTRVHDRSPLQSG